MPIYAEPAEAQAAYEADEVDSSAGPGPRFARSRQIR